jgi:hypothetical protein
MAPSFRFPVVAKLADAGKKAMMQYRAPLIAIAIFACLALPLSAAMQNGEPLPVTPGAGRYLPKAEEIGADWISVLQAGIAPGPELFQEGVKGVYGGPGGSRSVVYAWITQENEAAGQRAWQATADFMGSVQPEWGSMYKPSSAGELATPEAPPGCTEATRAEGLAASTQFPVGMTLCAVEPDVILLTIVSGEYDGVSGYRASDALLAKALEVVDNKSD